MEDIPRPRSPDPDTERHHTYGKKVYYAGELKRIHGDDEFEWMKEKGKLIETEDSDGDVCYIKSTTSQLKEMEHARQARIGKSGSAQEEGYNDLQNAFKSEYGRFQARGHKRKQLEDGEGSDDEKNTEPGESSDRKSKKNNQPRAGPKEPKELSAIQQAVNNGKVCIPQLVKDQGKLLSLSNSLAKKKLARAIRENALEILKESRNISMQLQNAVNASMPDSKAIRKLVIDGAKIIKRTKDVLKLGRPHVD